MAENIIVNGVTYNGVDSVEMRNTSGQLVQYIKPSGELSVNSNGAYDVTEKASVVVDVPPSAPTPTQFTNILTHTSTEIRLNQTHNGTARNGAICIIIDLAALGITTARKVEFRMRGFIVDLSYPNIMRSTDKSSWTAWKSMASPVMDNHGDMSATISSVNPATYPYLLVMFRNASSAATLDTYAGAILTINEPIGNGGYVG